MRRIALIAALAIGPALASGAEEQRAQGGQQGGQQAGQQLDGDLQKSLQKLHAANQAEIEIGQAAQERAQSQEVKQFAQQMTEDHRQADGRLQEIAQQFGVNLQGEEFQKALKESREKLSDLQKQQGAEFDRAYMDFMVKDHEEDVKSVHDAAMKASEKKQPQLAQVLGETEAKLHHHHARALQLNEQLEREAHQQRQAAAQQPGQPRAQQPAGSEPQAARPEQQAGQQGTGSTAQQPEPQGGQQAQSEGEQKSVVGTVQSVEGESLSLKNERGQTQKLSLSGNTRFMRGDQTISKDEIKEGDQVRASFRGEEGNLQATEIRVTGDKGAKGERGKGAKAEREDASGQKRSQERSAPQKGR